VGSDDLTWLFYLTLNRRLYLTLPKTGIFKVISIRAKGITETNVYQERRILDGSLRANRFDFSICRFLDVSGAPSEPRLTSGRVILITKLALSLILYAFYTSAIVTFLLTPVPRTIRTAEDLIRSPLKLGLEDYSYNRAVFPVSFSYSSRR